MQWQLIEIPFQSGLDQKKDSRIIGPGKLTKADNVEFDKAGALNKRRGYESLNVTTELFGRAVDEYMMHLAKHEDELLILGAESIFSVGDTGTSLPGTRSIVYRGICPRGNIRRQDVATSHTGSDTGIIPG